jgi:hypothetical protein
MGRQYTPVLSRPPWVQPPALSQSASCSNSAVVVPNVRVSATGCRRSPGVMRQTTAVRLLVWSCPGARGRLSCQR